MNFENLVLLADSNVEKTITIAKWFIRNNTKLKKVWVAYLNYKVDKNFAIILKDRIENVSGLIEVDYWVLRENTNFMKINQDIENKLKSTTGTFHLDYTGGNKMMAVGVHSAIKQYSEGATFSILDENEYKLFFDDDYRHQSEVLI